MSNNFIVLFINKTIKLQFVQCAIFIMILKTAKKKLLK